MAGPSRLRSACNLCRRWVGHATKRNIAITRSSVEVVRGDDDIIYPSAVPFLLVHAACFAGILTGVTWQAAAIGFVLYWARMFGVVAGYHRLFSHRSYTISRMGQFAIAWLAQSSGQKSVLWWAAKHRHHHLHSDAVQDVHSPARSGFFYSHVAWIFVRKHDLTDLNAVRDLTAYPELVWLHRFELLPAIALGMLCFLLAGWAGLIVGFFWSTVLVYHATFCINSLAHVHGSKRYVTGDDSRNNWLLAIFTMGEGWHNNHHAYPSSVRQGFRWWEVDIAFYLLKFASWFGLVRGLKAPPKHVLRNEHKLGSKVLDRAAEQLAGRFNAERIANTIAANLHVQELLALRARLDCARSRVGEILATLNFPSIPNRDDLVAEARAVFVKTRSLDDIVDKAQNLIYRAVGMHLQPI